MSSQSLIRKLIAHQIHKQACEVYHLYHEDGFGGMISVLVFAQYDLDNHCGAGPSPSVSFHFKQVYSVVNCFVLCQCHFPVYRHHVRFVCSDPLGVILGIIDRILR